MKKITLLGLLAISFLCFQSTTFSAQPAQTVPTETKTTKDINPSAVFEYSDISISDPSIYRDELFTISLTVKNTGNKEAKHEVLLLVKDEGAPEGQRKQASKFLALRAGQTETVTFTFMAADLMEALENTPEVFFFTIGEYEIGVGYEK
ncbi:hypothetical protein [Neolewinella persica]|uniref:hypothetical protein n=1 Tax=Neolewinella persica TaxID=70998 RepID=UPI0003813F00|nr:hypothetical protein [Neolewinella persica]